MMKPKKSLLLLLCLLLCVTLLASCGGGSSAGNTEGTEVETVPGTDPATEPVTEPATEPAPVGDISLKEFTIVYPADSIDAKGAASYMQGILAYIFRSSVRTQTDAKAAAEKEILIGQTNRGEAIDVSDLMGLDTAYRIVSDSRILIDAGSPAALKDAVTRFLVEQMDYSPVSGEGKANLLARGDLSVKKETYPVKSMTVNGRPIGEFTLVYDSMTGYRDVANDFRDFVLRSTGVYLPVSDTNVPGSAFYFGPFDENGEKTKYDYGDCLEGAIDGDGKTSVFVCGDSTILNDLAASFNEKYANVTANFAVTYPAAKRTYLYQKYLRDWTFVSKTEEVTLAEGITYVREHYTAGGTNIDFAVLKIKQGAAQFLIGTKADGTGLTDSRSKLTEQVASAAANGKNVIAGVNADFFAMEGDGSPSGSIVKDGESLHTNTGRPYFAMYRDGSVKIRAYAMETPDPDQVYSLVGGDPILLYEGKLYPMTRADGTDRKMRTLVGYNDEGDVVIAASDTQSGGSATTVTLYEAARYMRELGCTYAMGFDGGGSTEMVLRDPVSGNLSFGSEGYAYGGGVERAIYDSLLVVVGYEIPETVE